MGGGASKKKKGLIINHTSSEAVLVVGATIQVINPQTKVAFSFDTSFEITTRDPWIIISREIEKTLTTAILTYNPKRNTIVDNFTSATILVYPTGDPGAAYPIAPQGRREIIGLRDIATRNGNKINYRDLDSNNTMCCVDEFKFYLSIVDIFTTRVLVTP